MKGKQLSFGPFEITPQTGELRKFGRGVKLAEKPREALLLLLERAGEIVTREELRQRLWPADTFVEFDDNLNATIKRLRESLEDSALQPRFIETIPRRGYRFLAPVEHIPATLAPGQSPGIEAASTAATINRRPSWLSRSTLVATAIAIVLTLILAVSGAMHGRAAKQSIKQGNAQIRPLALAVMPILNLTGNPDQQFLAYGLTEDLIAIFGRISPEELAVIGHTSVIRATSDAGKEQQAVQSLGADYILRGTLRRSETGTLFEARLLSARDQHEFWMATFQFPLQEAFLGVLVTQRTAETLGIHAHIRDRTELSSSVTSNLAAYQAYLRGLYALQHENRTELLSALDSFDESLRHDPRFAMPLAGRARAYKLLSALGEMPQPEAQRRANAAIDAGIKLDSAIPDFFLLKGEILAKNDAANSDIEWNYQRALDLNSNDVEALEGYALYLRERRPPDALHYVEQARRLDPLSPRVIATSGWVLMSVGKFDEADARLQAALELDPKFPDAFLFLGNLERRRGHPNQAIAWFEKATDASRREPQYLYRLARAYAEVGRGDAVRRILAELRDRARSQHVEPTYIDSLEAMLGS